MNMVKVIAGILGILFVLFAFGPDGFMVRDPAAVSGGGGIIGAYERNQAAMGSDATVAPIGVDDTRFADAPGQRGGAQEAQEAEDGEEYDFFEKLANLLGFG
ncbi:MAG: hypothetical protein AAF675_06795 [Pseudomonadota bacterium]